jgi:hypothetical protein
MPFVTEVSSLSLLPLLLTLLLSTATLLLDSVAADSSPRRLSHAQLLASHEGHLPLSAPLLLRLMLSPLSFCSLLSSLCEAQGAELAVDNQAIASFNLLQSIVRAVRNTRAGPFISSPPPSETLLTSPPLSEYSVEGKRKIAVTLILRGEHAVSLHRPSLLQETSSLCTLAKVTLPLPSPPSLHLSCSQPLTLLGSPCLQIDQTLFAIEVETPTTATAPSTSPPEEKGRLIRVLVNEVIAPPPCLSLPLSVMTPLRLPPLSSVRL